LLAGLTLGLWASALAAKTATLTGPSTIADRDKWQRVCLSPLTLANAQGVNEDGVVATIDACARDATNPAIVECKSASRFDATPPAAVTNIVNYMINAYCQDHGC
jgi:hypothetical protein